MHIEAGQCDQGKEDLFRALEIGSGAGSPAVRRCEAQIERFAEVIADSRTGVFRSSSAEVARAPTPAPSGSYLSAHRAR
jgi:hypothetical protein